MSYTCPYCGAVSHNVNDEKHRYCGNCHRFAGQPDLESVVKSARNDSGKPIEQVVEHLKKSGVEVKYDDLVMLVEPGKLEEADLLVAAIALGDRQKIMWSIDVQLRAMLPIVKAGIASKKVMDNFHNDLLLWTALKKLS